MSARTLSASLLAAAFAVLGALACGTPAVTGEEPDGGSGFAQDDAGSVVDAGADAGKADAQVFQDDGTPTRQTCTSTFGSALTRSHARLDGYLVAVVPPGNGKCNADNDHIHLQVKMNQAIYDVAVNVASPTASDVLFAERDLPLPTEVWSEGWHTTYPLNYATSVNLHSGDFTTTTKAQLVQQVTAALKNANHVSIYGSGYGTDGMHLIHRNNGWDGAIVVRPLSASPHFMFFRFADQVF